MVPSEHAVRVAILVAGILAGVGSVFLAKFVNEKLRKGRVSNLGTDVKGTENS